MAGGGVHACCEWTRESSVGFGWVGVHLVRVSAGGRAFSGAARGVVGYDSAYVPWVTSRVFMTRRPDDASWRVKRANEFMCPKRTWTDVQSRGDAADISISRGAEPGPAARPAPRPRAGARQGRARPRPARRKRLTHSRAYRRAHVRPRTGGPGAWHSTSHPHLSAVRQ